jgi:hypothetical protein
MKTTPLRSALPAALLLALMTALVPRASAATWTPVAASRLQVTSGAVTTLASGLLQTRSPQMRSVERDNGRHAQWARLRFRYVQPSVGTSTLGSGAFRRQLGLKLQAGDPCNLLYVMWWEYPVHQIAISVKRNPGQDTSAECGNRGYTDVAKIPLPVAPSVRDHRTHVLEARGHRAVDGTLALTVLADGVRVYRDHLGVDLTAGLDGPIGVRSDNGTYRFSIFAGNRFPR